MFEAGGDAHVRNGISLHGETAGLKNFYQLIHTAYMLFFKFNTSPRKLSVSCDYCFLFVCLTLMCI